MSGKAVTPESGQFVATCFGGPLVLYSHRGGLVVYVNRRLLLGWLAAVVRVKKVECICASIFPVRER